MAGIGFVLRKLIREDNLLGLCRAFTHSALVSSGPWLLTILAIGTIVSLGSFYTSSQELQEFRLIVIYNFAFSLVFTAPVFMIATRYLADCIYKEEVSAAPGMLMGALLIIYLVQFPIVVVFYLAYASLPTILALSAIANFMLISSIWLIAVFLTALKDYKAITLTFAIGITVSITASTMLAKHFAAVGMLNGFSIGLALITSSLLAHVFAEYPYPMKKPLKLLHYFHKYWEVALGGLIYNLAVWVDKWVMWFAPEADRYANHMISYTHYDSAMFFAYLTIVPALAMFVFSIETSFFEKYLNFYRDIQRSATFQQIQENHKSIVRNITHNARNFLLVQGSISITIVLMSPRIFEFFGLNYLQIGIFRYGVLGAFFHILVLFLTILLSYFDNRRGMLLIYTIFLITNGGFTYFSMQSGFDYYGYGYFLSSVTTFVAAAIITAFYLNKLPYHTFLTRNTSVERQAKATVK